MNANRNRSKVLVPLATMAVAGAVIIGSGATFTSTSAHSVAVTSGILSHSNTKDGLELRVSNIKPGDSLSGSLVIENDGTLDSTLSLEETADSSSFEGGALKLTIADGATVLFDGNFGALNTKLDLGALPVGATKTVTYTVSMPAEAGNANQGKAASANYQYVTTQTGDNSGIGWF